MFIWPRWDALTRLLNFVSRMSYKTGVRPNRLAVFCKSYCPECRSNAGSFCFTMSDICLLYNCIYLHKYNTTMKLHLILPSLQTSEVHTRHMAERWWQRRICSRSLHNDHLSGRSNLYWTRYRSIVLTNGLLCPQPCMISTNGDILRCMTVYRRSILTFNSWKIRSTLFHLNSDKMMTILSIKPWSSHHQSRYLRVCIKHKIYIIIYIHRKL